MSLAEEVVGAVHQDATQDSSQVSHEAPEGVGREVMLRRYL